MTLFSKSTFAPRYGACGPARAILERGTLKARLTPSTIDPPFPVLSFAFCELSGERQRDSR